MIESAELCLTFDDDEYIALSLTETQMALIANILGLSYDWKSKGFWCRSDESLNKLLDMKTNPLKLKEVNQ